MILENDKTKLVWDFQCNLRKTETARRPDLILETKDEFGFATWYVLCNKILIRKEEVSLRDIDKFLLRQEKEDPDTLLRLYP